MNRPDKELIDATRPFAVESPARSWMHVIIAFGLFTLTLTATLTSWPLAARAAASVLEGLLLVRLFILFHDFYHGAILRGSTPARVFFWTYGNLVLTPPRVWRETHNYHHANNGKIVGSQVGSYPVVTRAMWDRMTGLQRAAYLATRHPVTIAFGALTVFAWGMCASPFLRDRRRHKLALVPIAMQVGLFFALTHTVGRTGYLLAVALPLIVATGAGSYLFYAQHNLPEALFQRRDAWNYVRAALESSSYMPMGAIMSFFTGNIGYHHVHHLNSSIPFYRLPEAMEAIPELQQARTTSLTPAAVLACFRLDVWDPTAGRMMRAPRGHGDGLQEG